MPKRLPNARAHDQATAHRAGMRPGTLDEIEIRGLRVDQARRDFVRPNIISWKSISHVYGVKEL